MIFLVPVSQPRQWRVGWSFSLIFFSNNVFIRSNKQLSSEVIVDRETGCRKKLNCTYGLTYCFQAIDHQSRVCRRFVTTRIVVILFRRHFQFGCCGVLSLRGSFDSGASDAISSSSRCLPLVSIGSKLPRLYSLVEYAEIIYCLLEYIVQVFLSLPKIQSRLAFYSIVRWYSTATICISHSYLIARVW